MVVEVARGRHVDRAGDVPGDRVDRLGLAAVALRGAGVDEHRRRRAPRRPRPPASRPGGREVAPGRVAGSRSRPRRRRPARPPSRRRAPGRRGGRGSRSSHHARAAAWPAQSSYTTTGRPRPDPGPPHGGLEDRRRRAAGAGRRRPGGAARSRVEVDVRRARDVPGGELAGARRAARPVAHVEHGHVPEPRAQLGGADRRRRSSGPVMASLNRRGRAPAATGASLPPWLNFTSSPAPWTRARARSRCRRTTTTPRAAGSAGSSPPTTGPARRCCPRRLGLTHEAIEVAAGLRLLDVRRRHADPGRPDRLPDLRRGAVLHRATRSTSWPRSSTSCRSTSSPSASSPTSARRCSRAAPGWSSSPTG